MVPPFSFQGVVVGASFGVVFHSPILHLAIAEAVLLSTILLSAFYFRLFVAHFVRQRGPLEQRLSK